MFHFMTVSIIGEEEDEEEDEEEYEDEEEEFEEEEPQFDREKLIENYHVSYIDGICEHNKSAAIKGNAYNIMVHYIRPYITKWW